MRVGLDHAGWLRLYARGVRRGEMEEVAGRLLLAADELEVLAGGRVRFEDYARVGDAAERVGVHVESVRRWLRGERVGVVWLIRLADLEEFAEGYSRGAW